MSDERAPAIVWYRNDLRVRDHEPLLDALRGGGPVIPVYCFDPRHFRTTSFGFPRTGPFRGRFLLESVADLRRSLRTRGADLVVRTGRPEDVLPSLVSETGARAVHVHAEVTWEETQVERAVEEALGRTPLRRTHGATLHHPDTLPFDVARLPELFTDFRKAVEKECDPRPALRAPETLPAITGVEPGEIPTAADLGLEDVAADPRGVLPFDGGETAGLERVRSWVWEGDHLRRYRETRNGLLGADYSSKLSPWLALGCLSPRTVHDEVRRYEVERVRNRDTYWLVFELLWRDYFRFVCAKHGRRVFFHSGLRRLDLPWKQDAELFARWRDGTTGYPFVDANMRELAATGFMSNRGRQNVASFLTKNLGIDWRMGAEWFESRLIDHDVCSNWGNWLYAAGVGNDARGFRWFDVVKQGKQYDPDGDHVRHWLPELAGVDGPAAHEPWKLDVDYPAPVVDLRASADANRRFYDEAR